MHVPLPARLILLLALSVVGCDSKDQAEVQPHESDLTKDWTTPTTAEAQRYAEKLETQVASNALSSLRNNISWDVLFDRVSGGLGFDENELAGIKQGWMSAARGNSGLVGLIASTIKEKGSYQLLRVHTEDGQPRALFRLLRFDGGLSYHDYLLLKRPDGQIKAIDMHDFFSGELISQSMRRMLLTAAAEQNKGLIDRLKGQESEYVRHFDKLQALMRAVQQKDHRKVLRVYKTLPPSLRGDRTMMLIRVQAAAHLEHSQEQMPEYDQAVKDFRRAFADDPSIDLLSVDAHLAEKQYDQALAAVDRLQKALGGDPYLDVLRAGVWAEQGDYDQAQQLLQRARKNLPEMDSLQLSVVGMALAREDYETVLNYLIDAEVRYGIEFVDPTTQSEYRGFVHSPQYEKWKNRHKRP